MENVRISKVTRLGTGLAIVIPRAILRGMKIQRGDQVVIAAHDENIFAVRRLTPEELHNLKPGEVKF